MGLFRRLSHFTLRQSSLVLLGFAVPFVASQAQAQTKPFDRPTGVASKNTPEGYGLRSGSLVVAPIPFESPSLGTGLALGGGYLFQNDGLSDASSIGFGGFKSSNDSYGYGGGLNLAWNEDRWTLQILAAEANLNYDLYLASIPFGVNQELSGARVQMTYSPYENVGFGGSLAYGEYTLRAQSGGVIPEDFFPDVAIELARLSAFAEYDTRDDTIFPTRGSYVSGTLAQGNYVDSGRDPYSKFVLSASGYHPLFSEGVIAGRLVGCYASKNAPFFDACALGQTDAFRGYVSTEFIDDALFSVQTEYRGRLIGRVGYVVFAGAGSVAEGLSSAVGGSYRTAAGVGLRLRLSKEFPLDYAIDYSTNERGEELLYISVGQRF